MRHVDLFAGLGGFSVGLKRHVESTEAVEVDEVLRELYERNFGVRPHGDIRQVTPDRIGRHDLLTAGFPCQPFSKAGAQQGFDCNVQGDLFSESVLPILSYHKPSVVVLENVPNITRHAQQATWALLLAALEEQCGYHVVHRTLSPHEFGVPQKRPRVFLVGFRSKRAFNRFSWPEGSAAQCCVHDIIDEGDREEGLKLSTRQAEALSVWSDFLNEIAPEQPLTSTPLWGDEFGATYPTDAAQFTAHPDYAEKLPFKGCMGCDLTVGDLSRRDVDALPSYALREVGRFPEWKARFINNSRRFFERHEENLSGWKRGLQRLPPSFRKLEWNAKGEPLTLRDKLIQFRPSGIRVRRSTFSPSLVSMTTTQVPAIGWLGRFMSSTELARLQGLDRLEHLPKQKSRFCRAIGNAVCPQIVSAIGERIVEAL